MQLMLPKSFGDATLLTKETDLTVYATIPLRMAFQRLKVSIKHKIKF